MESTAASLKSLHNCHYNIHTTYINGRKTEIRKMYYVYEKKNAEEKRLIQNKRFRSKYTANLRSKSEATENEIIINGVV